MTTQDFSLSSPGRAGYSKTEVAQAYFPHVEANTARRNLRNWIMLNTELSQRLLKAGYRPRQRYFTPMQLGILYEFLGEP